MIKRLLLLTAIFGFAVSCNDYEDDFANLNDQLNGVNAKLDNIQTAVDGIAGVQLELLNINSALAAISSSIADLPTVEDIAGLANLINSTSSSLAAQMSDLDSDLQAVAASIIAELAAMEDMIENGFLAVNTSLTALGANIQIIDDEISVLQTGVLDLASAVAIVDGKIVAVDNELDTLLSNLTGQLAAQLTDITAQFAAVTGVIDANQSQALIWYLNTMAGIGRVEVDLEAVDAQNAAILQQLAGMLTVVQNGFATQSAELTAAEAAILAEITLVQQSLATTLLEIAGLETLVNAIQSSIDGTGGVDDQLAVINALIVSLQSDLTTLLESTTTIYQGDVTITNSAQLDYAVELDNKVMVINGAVIVDSNFATDAALLASLNGVMDKFKTVTGAVTITSASDLTMTNLNSVGGNYTLTGFNITDSALASVAGNAVYNYNSDSYVEQNLVNVGGSLTISNNGAATVDFSNLATVTGFVINDGAANPAVTNTLVNTDTITLGAGITDADVAAVGGSPAVITLSITADSAEAVSVNTAASFTVLGDTFDVPAVTLSGATVTSTLEDITGNISATATGVLTFAANNLGVAAVGGQNPVAASPITVALTSNGSNIDLNDVVASTFTVSDTGAAASDTDFAYNSMLATSFTYLSTTASAGNGAINKFVTTGSATSAWTVGTTSMTSLRNVQFTLLADTDVSGNGTLDACEQGIVLTGDLSITTTGSGAGIDVDFGNMIGDLTLSAGGAMNVDSYVAAATTAAIVGDSSITSGTNSATGAANMTVNYRVIDCTDPTDTLANRTSFTGVTTGNVTHSAGSVNDAGTLTYRGATNTGTYSGAAAGNMTIGSGLDFTDSFTVTSLKAGGTLSFGAATTVAGAISVTGAGIFNGTNFSATATRTGDLSISAGGGITLPTFTSLGASTNAAGDATTYTTTLATTTGALDISAVTDIAAGATISSTTGAIDASALTHIDTVIGVSSTTGAIDLSAVTIIGTAAVAAGQNTAAVDAIPVNTSVTSTSGAITLTALTSVISNDATLNAGTGALAAASLATHTGTAIALGGVMELQALASSTGSIALSGTISDDHILDALATFVSMTSSVPTMILNVYASGTFDITSTALTAPSIALADLSADALVTLTLTAQASDIAIGAGDYAALTTLAVTTNAAGLDSIVLDAADALVSATLAGKADVLQVMNNTALTTLNPAALANKGAAQTGSKVHIINNDALTAVETGTSKMHELKIMGNAELTTIDLTSYLTAGNAPAANDTVTAADLATVTFTLDITGNKIAGTLLPVNNAGQQTTGLISAELAPEAKLIAAHLFGFTQGTVVAQADFVGLQATTNSEDQFNNTTDFSTAGGGINTAAEWALMTAN
jgi:hypothetical protein